MHLKRWFHTVQDAVDFVGHEYTDAQQAILVPILSAATASYWRIALERNGRGRGTVSMAISLDDNRATLQIDVTGTGKITDLRMYVNDGSSVRYATGRSKRFSKHSTPPAKEWPDIARAWIVEMTPVRATQSRIYRATRELERAQRDHEQHLRDSPHTAGQAAKNLHLKLKSLDYMQQELAVLEGDERAKPPIEL